MDRACDIHSSRHCLHHQPAAELAILGSPDFCIEQHHQCRLCAYIYEEHQWAGTVFEQREEKLYLATILQNVVQEWQVVPPKIP